MKLKYEYTVITVGNINTIVPKCMEMDSNKWELVSFTYNGLCYDILFRREVE